MEILKKSKRQEHPYIPELKELYRAGRCSRREFLQTATLLGMSLAAASTFLAACGPAAEEETPVATAAPTGGINRGGTMTVATRVQRLDHPARLSWIEGANAMRLVNEYLTFTDWDNITHPWLLDHWDVNETVDEWTLYLREGIKFNDGSDFMADDVIFSMQQWFDEAVGSSIAGLMSYLTPNNIEKIDDYTIKLHLSAPQIGVPEHLFHYPALIVPRTFEGDWVRQPVGTGPFTLSEYMESERAVFVRREDYWKMGEDGSPLPYLDQVTFLDLGEEEAARIAALQSGQVDNIFNPSADIWQAVKDLPGIGVYATSTAQTFVIRMRVDTEPFSDNRVRQALKKCIDRQAALDLAWFGEGALGHDAHIAPVHPAYCEKPIPAYDPEGARALLAEAGYPDGLTVDLFTQEARAEPAIAQSLAETARDGGFTINLNILPSASYWDMWTEVDLGITIWAHRPLGTMVPALAYTADEAGNPGAWNETRWVDEEYSELLHQAEQTVDVEARREIFCQMEDIQQERGSVGIAFWTNVWYVCHEKFQNVRAHPTNYDHFDNVWIQE
ncbi:MAG: ABC transporter substrate-binding protein [Anaerolineae bacterium]|nr:ABC transporter substrate-binding protein [Anaerolineae bacterium]